MRAAELFDARLLVVTGKGGTGKTSVAAALAVAAAAKGHEVLLAEVEGRQGLARLFDLPALEHEESPLTTPEDEDTGTVTGLAVDPRIALREYLDHAGVAVLGGLLDKAGLVDVVTAAAPGLGDALLVGKLGETAMRAADGRPAYDLVILDAPPSGRVVPFLRAPASVAGLARYGPLAGDADRVAKLLEDPARTRVVLTTLPEALPVAETGQTARELAEAGIAVGLVVANSVTAAASGLDDSAQLDQLAADPEPLLAAAGRAGLRLDRTAVAALVAEGVGRTRRRDAEQRHLDGLRQTLGTEIVELPVLPGGVPDAGAVRVLAGHLAGVGPRRMKPEPPGPLQLEAPKMLPPPPGEHS